MELYEAMSSLRAVRRLKAEPIDEEILERVLTAATWAPTGGNHQPWRIIAVKDPVLKQGLQQLYKPHWDGYVPAYKEHLQNMPTKEAERSRKALASGTYLAEHMHEVPVICAFCFNTDHITVTDAGLDRQSVVGGGSIYPAVQNLLLAARNEGLGCVLTTLLCIEEPKVKALLDIPSEWHTAAFVPLGYPVLGGHGPITRKPIAKMVYKDRFGQALD